MRKILMLAAVCSTVLSPILSVPAYATVASSVTTDIMATTCTTDLGANAATVLHDGTPAFSTEVVETGFVDGTPSEVSGSRVETLGSRFGTGSATYSGLSIAPIAPYRIGGSVNMFGDRVATEKNWANSEYDFTADYATVTTFSYGCHVTQQTETYHPAVHIPARPVLGYYEVDPDFKGNEEAAQNSCNAFNAQAPVAPDYNAPGYWGVSPHANCVFVQTADATDAVDEDEYWTLDAPTPRADLLTSHTVDETNVAEGTGHEANAGPWTQSGSWFVAQVVICNSPKRLPGIWTQQNGYTGNLCTTTHFNTNNWSHGSQTSNGTYISVPAS
jgi:hypothetical protein